MAEVYFILCIHNHQPVGNFGWVVEEVYRQCYLPLIQTLAEFPSVKFCLHNSGSLLEVLESIHPEYMDMLGELVERGQVEILTGGFYEPILSMIPEDDRVGQIRALSDYLARHLGTSPRGMWIAERVWEPHYPSSLARAGVEYTVVDDYHFLSTGLGRDDLYGYYLTDDIGEILTVFPGSKKLRYLIPFADTSETLAFLRELAETGNGHVAVFADDGEKFGVWPGTFKHVYEDGWLRAFLTMLTDHQSWIRTTTFSEYMDRFPPKGRVYLPTAAYSEMMEWALPNKARKAYSHVLEKHKNDAETLVFLKGGFWRNFLAKYPESHFMQSRMLYARQRVESIRHVQQLHQEAVREVWKAQCNCAYWHGIFGGLYLPHLRSAVYEHIIKAEGIVRTAQGSGDLSISLTDIDGDLTDEVLVEDDDVFVCIDPAVGGSIVELDVKKINFNLMNTLSRREEAYHRDLSHSERDDLSSPASIHNLARSAEEGLRELLFYDKMRKASFMDHLIPHGTTLESLYRGTPSDVSSFFGRPYGVEISGRDRDARIILTRQSKLIENGNAGGMVRLRKVYAFPHQGVIHCNYLIENPDLGARGIVFGVEFNFSLPGPESDRKRYYCHGSRIAQPQLDSLGSVENASHFGIIDQDVGVEVAFEVSLPCTLWRFPIETVSVSEVGFEKIYQSSCLVPTWQLGVGSPHWSVDLNLSIKAI